MVDWPHVEAMPGAELAVRALSSLAVQCVATNAADSDGNAVAAALERVCLRDRLTHFVTSSEIGVAKPDPEFFAKVARRVGLLPAALLAVGNDYAKDVVPAKATGMMTVWVSRENASEAWEAADLIVPDLGRLAELVGS